MSIYIYARNESSVKAEVETSSRYSINQFLDSCTIRTIWRGWNMFHMFINEYFVNFTPIIKDSNMFHMFKIEIFSNRSPIILNWNVFHKFINENFINCTPIIPESNMFHMFINDIFSYFTQIISHLSIQINAAACI